MSVELEMELFKREVESRLDRSDDKLDRMTDSVQSLADSVGQLVERDIRNQERENRQSDHNEMIDLRLRKVEEKQQIIKDRINIGFFKVGLMWSCGAVICTMIVALAVGYLKTQGIDLKP